MCVDFSVSLCPSDRLPVYSLAAVGAEGVGCGYVFVAGGTGFYGVGRVEVFEAVGAEVPGESDAGVALETPSGPFCGFCATGGAGEFDLAFGPAVGAVGSELGDDTIAAGAVGEGGVGQAFF